MREKHIQEKKKKKKTLQLQLLEEVWKRRRVWEKETSALMSNDDLDLCQSTSAASRKRGEKKKKKTKSAAKTESHILVPDTLLVSLRSTLKIHTSAMATL